MHADPPRSQGCLSAYKSVRTFCPPVGPSICLPRVFSSRMSIHPSARRQRLCITHSSQLRHLACSSRWGLSVCPSVRPHVCAAPTSQLGRVAVLHAVGAHRVVAHHDLPGGGRQCQRRLKLHQVGSPRLLQQATCVALVFLVFCRITAPAACRAACTTCVPDALRDRSTAPVSRSLLHLPCSPPTQLATRHNRFCADARHTKCPSFITA
jgi:hypothetical protein